MASIGAIAGIRDDATKRLLAAAAVIAEQTGVDVPVFESFRQPDYHQAMQLKVLADWAERLAAVEPDATEETPAEKKSTATKAKK